jgi:uncharacterized protein (DUF2062 family)
VFKRRIKRTYIRVAAEAIYPRGGWSRAVSYVVHRLQRLPDPPHRIARGVAAGVFVCFTPFFGFHFMLAASLAAVLQGNILASILATFFGNPLTFPIIATLAIELGNWMLGYGSAMPLPEIVQAFYDASIEIWFNISAMFTSEVAHWNRLDQFFHRVFLPYLVGGLVPGVIVSVIMYSLSRPLIAAYQKRRIKRLKLRYEKKRLAGTPRAGVVPKAH